MINEFALTEMDPTFSPLTFTKDVQRFTTNVPLPFVIPLFYSLIAVRKLRRWLSF